MAEGSTLRYEGIPLADFLAALGLRERPGLLPAPSALKEALLSASWSPVPGEASPLSLYLLEERDALTQTREAYLLVKGEGRYARPLRELVLRLGRFFRGRNLPVLFRIDPRYGLLVGSALEPLDPAVKWDRPRVYAALAFTADPASPSLALLEYVPASQQAAYRALFVKYNGVEPARPGLLTQVFRRWKGSRAEGEAGPGGLTYGMLATLGAFLQRESVEKASLSLIFKGISPSEAAGFVLDPGRATFYPSGYDRFFASLGELA
ncbi:MAG: hypothetical protein ACP5VN_03210 [Acidobacteriota bacterium]